MYQNSTKNSIDTIPYVSGILSDFANFLWDFGKLEMKTQIPPFETPEKLVNWYLSIYGNDINNKYKIESNGKI